MMVAKDRQAQVCSRVCALGVLLVLILALGMRAQQAQGAGASPSEAIANDDALTTSPPSSMGSAEPAKAAPPSPVAAPSAAQAKPSLADFAWLAGRWQGAWGPRVAQQVWMPPKGGVMLGTFQTVDNGATLVIELFTIVENPNGISLYSRHFTPTLEPWEKSKATLLKLASSTSKAIEFDNPVDGQPKREIIRRLDADTYVSRAEIVPDKGDPQVVEITYHRQKEAAAIKH